MDQMSGSHAIQKVEARQSMDRAFQEVWGTNCLKVTPEVVQKANLACPERVAILLAPLLDCVVGSRAVLEAYFSQIR